jgi:hypothetical protein
VSISIGIVLNLLQFIQILRMVMFGEYDPRTGIKYTCNKVTPATGIAPEHYLRINLGNLEHKEKEIRNDKTVKAKGF